ncbi:MAG: prolyl oligopeptidase family serine peptidase [Bacteroidota bacterium]
MLNRLLLLTFGLCLAAPLHAQERPLSFVDLMQMKTTRHASLSDDGQWMAFTAMPDRGDSEVHVYSTDGQRHYTVPNASFPVFSADGRFAAMTINPTLAQRETADKDDMPRKAMALLATATGGVHTVTDVESFGFSADGRWLGYHHFPFKGEDGETVADEAGTLFMLRNLDTKQESAIDEVKAYAFSPEQPHMVYATATANGSTNSLVHLDLTAASPTGSPNMLHTAEAAAYAELTWHRTEAALAFVVSTDSTEAKTAALMTWVPGNDPTERVAVGEAPEGWHVPSRNTLRWSDDGARLFFGFRPVPDMEPEADPADSTAAFDPYDLDAILADREVDVWHDQDPLVNTQQKQRWKGQQERTYMAAYHLAEDRYVPLETLEMAVSSSPTSTGYVVGRVTAPYEREVTWDGSYFDLYAVSLDDGERTMIAERLGSTTQASPGGRYVVFYHEKNYHLYDTNDGSTRNLTADLGVPIANEDHDYPSAAPGYGIAGWTTGDAAVLLYDKYDLWHLPADGSTPIQVTNGRATDKTFRIIRTDPNQRAFAPDASLMLSSYDNERKNSGFYRVMLNDPASLTALREESNHVEFVDHADDADRILFTQENYDEFPNYWITSPDFSDPARLTDVNPQVRDFAWGNSELIEWTTPDDVRLQGVVIKPDGFEEGKQYPVLVYFYRFMSQRLHQFNDPRVNHRPSFPVYASDGYIVFLPDVRFQIGAPGISATRAVVSGVQKLVDLGWADPAALGLHGHSWSGYQTAFIVTQTDMFDAAVAGAPVSNMTSAYGGIRWASGRARQFQYEKTQSRLGGSLWEVPERYIDNSPLFFADRITTPTLIQFGDDDGAVPWYQGIELYLAMRRLDKDVVFLQYRGEGHHLSSYANKLDYAIKMKEYFDHYLKGAPAPAWITDGVLYNGK